jgi:RNAse (barnase) inhibitor barstar
MLLVYYIISVIYCFYQLSKKYKTRGVDYGTSPEMDAIMVLVMAWVLAPVDVSITWINMVKKAEEAKRRQETIDLFKGDSEKEKQLIRDSIY